MLIGLVKLQSGLLIFAIKEFLQKFSFLYYKRDILHLEVVSFSR